MYSLFYQILIALLVLVMLPKFIYQRLRYGKYRQRIGQRFGLGLPSPLPGDCRRRIWVHAVSVGETRALVELVTLLSDQNTLWIVSSVTETGQKEAKKIFPEDSVFVFLPIDFYCIMKNLLEKWRPTLVLISETDLWYHFLLIAKESGASIALVNGKISERSAKRLSWASFFSKRLFSQIDLFCLQNKEYARLFQHLGVSADKIQVTGNLKWDCVPAQSTMTMEEIKKAYSIPNDRRIIVIGSTHAGEEEVILNALSHLTAVTFLVVPRHPERFEKVRHLLKNYASAILIDKMGVLTACYSCADLAIVGGSFVPGVGGHNLLEPAQYKVPVLFGPYTHNQSEMVRLVLEAHAGAQVSIEALGTEVSLLLEDRDASKRAGEAGYKMLKSLRGASFRTAELLQLLKLSK